MDPDGAIRAFVDLRGGRFPEQVEQTVDEISRAGGTPLVVGEGAEVLGVVPVLRDSCGGCFNAIPPQVQSEIKQHKKVIQCEHCGRILVDAELA